MVAYIFCLYHIHKPTGLPAHRRLINDLKAIRKDLESSYSELVNTQSKFVEHPPTVWGSQPLSIREWLGVCTTMSAVKHLAWMRSEKEALVKQYIAATQKDMKFNSCMTRCRRPTCV